jgi:conjugative relaxase-like TrwC/TraI family protein
VLTISSGHSVDYLTREVATGRENYYTGAVTAGEPPGRWYGTGAEALGLAGLVDHQDMTALYEHFIDPRDPNFRNPDGWDQAATLGHKGRRYLDADELYRRSLDAEPNADAERREQLRLDASKKARKNVAFLDATFSVQKSITVLHTAFEAQEVNARRDGDEAAAEAWAAHKQAVEDAIWVGNRAGLDYLAEKAGYSRVGHHGGAAGRFVDAHDWTIASFFQHDSRNRDPQLHIHNAILNRVLGLDGIWRTLDSRAIHKFRAATAAVAERVMEEHLARALGIRFATRPDGKAREILGIRQRVMDLFSSRRRAITAKTTQLVAAFETKYGYAPNALQLDRLQRQATLATRPGKSHDGETLEQRLDRWERQLRAEIDGGLAQVAHDVLAIAGQAPPAAEWSVRDVIAAALADVQSKKAAWTAADLTRAISDALPDRLGDLDGPQVAALLDDLTASALQLAVPLDATRPGDGALPDELRLANGRSAYDTPGGRLYATPEHVHTERLLAAAATHRDAPALDATIARRFVERLAEAGIELGADQAAAVRGVLTSHASVESLVGPAGTGKSFAVGVLAKAWQDPALWDGHQRKVIGLASSQIATDILTGEGLAARNIGRWLATQRRLIDGSAFGDDHEWRLNPGDLVVVDESAMADTAQLGAIHRMARDTGAKLLLTGDHRQLAAVGAVGGMELAAESGAAYELSEARRFTHAWERDASLRLRDGDESVLGEYHKHGRLIDAGTIEQAQRSAARAWLGDTLAGKRSLVVVDTNEQADRLSAQVRTELVRLGHVHEDGVPLGLQGTMAGVGDLVQARRNQWDLAGLYGNRRGPINREQYRVLATLDDGGLVVAPIHGRTPDGEQLGARMTLPGSYVAEHVALGYASTVHSAQGLTVDTSHAVVTSRTGHAALYVELSRGRQANTAHVTTRAIPDDAPPGLVKEAIHREPAAVLSVTFDTAELERSALATAVESDTEARSVRTAAELFADGCELATAGRTASWLDQLVDAGHLTAEQRIQLAAEDGSATLNRVLRRAELAGHDPRQVLTDAITSRHLDDARQLANVIHHRVSENVSLDPIGDHYIDWIPKVDNPSWQRYLSRLAADADTRRIELGAHAAETQPQWAVEALGPVPTHEDGRDDWQMKAGIVAAHRELAGLDDDTTALSGPPKAGQVEVYASWRAAWRALGRPEVDRDEAELSDGQLLLRVRAYDREQAWAPRYVANELAGTVQAAQHHRATAQLRAAEAEHVADVEEGARLAQEAADAAALADVLDSRAARLHQVDEARARWYAHTAATRAGADRAELELAARRAADDQSNESTTAKRRLADADERAARDRGSRRQLDDRTAERDIVVDRRHLGEPTSSQAGQDAPRSHDVDAASRQAHEDKRRSASARSAVSTGVELADDEQHSEITDEHDLAEVAEQREADRRAADDSAHPDAAEIGDSDLREQTAREAQPEREDEVRVPSAEETADAVRRAQRALAEIDRREAVERRRTAEERRVEQLARWHTDDRADDLAIQREDSAAVERA